MYEKRGENQTISTNQDHSYPTEAYNTKKYNIMIVDEDLEYLNLYKQTFESQGHKVKTALGRDEAFNIIHKGGLDAIITEIELPESSTGGLHVMQTSLLHSPDVPVIIHTGYNSERILAVLESIGAYAVLKKSADSPKKLMDLVSEALNPKQEIQNSYEGAKILFVDGNKMASNIYQGDLKNAGYKAKTASNAKEAISIIDQEEIDLVITDINLNAFLDGLSIIDKTKAKDPTIPVILYTDAETKMVDSSEVYTVVKREQGALQNLIHTTIREALAQREKELSPLSDGTIERYAKEVEDQDVTEVTKKFVNEFKRAKTEFLVKKYVFD